MFVGCVFPRSESIYESTRYEVKDIEIDFRCGLL